MKDKYKKFYIMFDKSFKNLILFSNLNSDCGVSCHSDLKGDNYGSVGSNGFCVWNGRSGRTSACRKTYKDFKRKRDSRRQLQGRVNHCSNSVRYR